MPTSVPPRDFSHTSPESDKSRPRFFAANGVSEPEESTARTPTVGWDYIACGDSWPDPFVMERLQEYWEEETSVK